MQRRHVVRASVAALTVLAPEVAHAAPALDGAAMSWLWGLPFAGILLSIAIGPLLFPKIWHDHYGKIAALWALATLLALALVQGFGAALDAFLYAMLAEYMSFILLLFALYTVAGGIVVTGNLRGTPGTNTAMLGAGTLMASVVGTTGASMILIRPVIRANDERRTNVHVVVFFIFLVANIGGALSPLGDPPLFVGFLRGVDFFWTTRHLLAETALVAGIVLATFFIVDLLLYKRDGGLAAAKDITPPAPFRIRGRINILLLGLIIALILGTASWKSGIALDLRGVTLSPQGLARDAGLVLIAILSLRLTADEHRDTNAFSWEPMKEVAKLFAGIFVCIVPVLAMLHAEERGAFAWLFHAVTGPAGAPKDLAYFWLTGSLSAFLDNAPTYLVFFELAGGDPQQLMGPLATTLAAISMGAVYMGAMTYVGNAPNFMVYAVAVERGVRMPSFFGFLGWAAVFLLPVFGLLSWLFIAG